MSRIVPKLNLNKTPQLVENNSLVMAKNIRLLEDGTIGPDTSLKEIATKTGNISTHTVHHNAVTEDITEYQYSILDVETSMSYRKDGQSIDESNLENLTFDFVNYLPTNVMHLVDEDKYIKVDGNISCTIYCYQIVNTEPQWTRETFTYNPNTELLINNNGFCFALAVRQDIYDEDPQVIPDVLEYYYCIVPTHLLNHSIEIKKYNYFLINPVYPSSETETITISEAWDEVVTNVDTPKYLGQIVGLDNKVYFFIEDLATEYSDEIQDELEKQYSGECFVTDDPLETRLQTFDVNEDNLVTRRGIIFEDRNFKEQIVPAFEDRVKILEFDEITEIFKRVRCGWKYSGGKIDGCVFKNNTGDNVLTICEYDVSPGKHIPIKHINLSSCKSTDNESIYTQNPNIPITNLNLNGEYPCSIPSGVYQFFVRYKIDDNRYTSWFPCSKEYFAGTKKRIATIQGELKYIDKHVDANNSFIFDVQHLIPTYEHIYQKFQIGFILSKDDNSIVAREWKEFDFSTTVIYFTTFKDDIKEINIDDLLETTYEIFNVKNCINYKTKLYIANYEETDFNPNFQNIADQINIKINAYNIGGVNSGLYLNGELMLSSGNNDYYDYINTINGNNHIRNKWAKLPSFNLNTHSLESIDFTGYFTLDEYGRYIVDNHFHIENSNVEEGDSQWCNPRRHDDDDEAWMSSRNSYYYNEASILAIYLKSGNNEIIITANLPSKELAEYPADDYHHYVGEGPSCVRLTHSTNTYSSICVAADNYIRNRIAYYNNNDHKWYILGRDNNYYAIDEYYIVYSVNEEVTREHIHIDQWYNSEHEPMYHHNDPYQGWIGYEPDFDKVYTKKTTRILKRELGFDTSYVTASVGDNKTYPTLLPFTKYNFYVHYIKSNGVITNGYLINNTDVYLNKYAKVGTGYTTIGNVSHYTFGNPINKVEDDELILYPSFENLIAPPGYIGAFITAAKVGNNVCQLFNVSRYTDKVDSSTTLCKADCLELDTLCYTQYDKLKIYSSNGTLVSDDAKYYDSGNTDDVSYFGECGSVVWTMQSSFFTGWSDSDEPIFWLVIETEETAKRFIKFTPYIKLNASTPTIYDNYSDITNLGYVCYVKKLLKGDDKYISGTDLYEITRTNGAGNTTATLDLEALDSDTSDFTLIKSNKECRIKSNFNFEYLTLSEDVLMKIKTVFDNNNSENILTCMIDSLISSYIYEFQSYYKEYTRKQYSEVDYTKKTIFNNTIRSSRAVADEAYNTFKFDASDYYNVPPLRGIIVKLISIANTIYVHCQHSLFKFSDNKTINADSEELTLQENDVFNSGITEVFDAQYGYAGLNKKEHGLITYNAYIFYDETSKIIYAFGGEQQIGNISQSINKLIEAINPDDVKFVADELHNRFFVNFKVKTDNVCLSFNFASKSFISIHDFDFKFGFHTRSNTYYIHENLYSDIPIGFSLYKIVDYIKTLNGRNIDSNPNVNPDSLSYNKNYSAYQNCYKKSFIHISDCDDVLCFNEVKSVNSCVDIIVNIEYEKIKVLNYLSWICSAIERYGYSENNISEEVINRNYPGHKIRIYSDSTEMALYELLDNNEEPKIANEYNQYYDNTHERADRRAWQYPQNNCGVWSMNYFRDVKNIIDIFNYKADKNKITGGEGHSQTTDLTPQLIRENLTQESSLLYGKYFVVRFIFNNKNFKLENLILRMNDYEKTK